jgi:hypothetical protein
MRYVGLYHLNAYTYADPTWFPEMNDELRSTVKNVTRGSVSAKGSWIGRLASRYRIGVSQLNADYDLGLDLTGPLAWLSPAPDVLGIT